MLRFILILLILIVPYVGLMPEEIHPSGAIFSNSPSDIEMSILLGPKESNRIFHAELDHVGPCNPERSAPYRDRRTQAAVSFFVR